jgi:hypothetical protein
MQYCRVTIWCQQRAWVRSLSDILQSTQRKALNKIKEALKGKCNKN